MFVSEQLSGLLLHAQNLVNRARWLDITRKQYVRFQRRMHPEIFDLIQLKMAPYRQFIAS